MADDYDYDFFVIGGGSGGVRASRMAASFGAKVALAEMGRLGGTCVNVGCIPKKLLYYASEYSRDATDARGYGWQVPDASHSWSQLIANKDREIARLNGIYAHLLDQAGVTVIHGRARLLDDHTIEVGDTCYRAKYILVATGSAPWLPDAPGAELALTSNEVFFLPEMPRRVVVVGGGYIAVELASIFHGLGAAVSLVHRREWLLRGFDEDIRRHVTEELRAQGIRLLLPNTVERLEKLPTGDGIGVTLGDGSQLQADQVLCALGRKPLVTGLGLEDAGVDVDADGAIVVDDYSRTTTPNIFAVGDVTNRVNLTPVAIAEGAAVAQTLFNSAPTRPDHRDVPSAVFCIPNVGTVGLTEEQARQTYREVLIYRSEFRELKHTLSGREEKAYMKLIVEARSERVVGLHMVGDHAGDIVQGFAVAMKMGATKQDFDRTVGVHPTAAEEFVTMRNPST